MNQAENSPEDSTAALERIAAQIASCRNCPLHQTRRHTVPGEGPADAQVMIVAEGPGEHEERQGRPFVGPSGNVLRQLLESAGVSRDAIFITNVIKCRAPNNRAPNAVEIEACRPFLEQQLDAIKPRVIVPLGSAALNWFRPGSKITREQGQPALHAPGQVILPFVHPAAGLRSKSLMDSIFEEFPKLGYWLEIMNLDADPPSSGSGSAPVSPPRIDFAAPPEQDGPARRLGQWLGQEVQQIHQRWQEDGDPALRYDLTALASLVGAARNRIPAQDPSGLSDVIADIIALGSDASQTMPHSCDRCHQWHYPPATGETNRCANCQDAP